MTVKIDESTYSRIEVLIKSINDPVDSLRLMALLVKLWSRVHEYRQAQLHGTGPQVIKAQLEVDAVLGELGL